MTDDDTAGVEDADSEGADRTDEAAARDGDRPPDGGDGATAVRRERFTGGPAREFMSSLAADRRIFAADLAVDRAHVVMLAEQGIVDDGVAGEILAALGGIEAAGHRALPDGEDVHEAIETAVIDGVVEDGNRLVDGVGPEGGRMHTARSRNDEVATCIRYRLREDLLESIETTIGLRAELLAAAEEEAGTLLPGYTHLQPAQPVTVGHYLLSYERAVARDTERLFAAYERTDRCPLGAAAFAGTAFDIDRERVADLLGFDAVLDNSMDAVSTRDFLLEAAGALATLATTLSGLAEDLIVYANRDFVDLGDAYASTSSIMPQKKNPDSVELVRATAGDAAASLQGLVTTLKGLPRSYNRDLQRATPHAWATVDEVTAATDVVGGAVATAEWNAAALSAAAAEGFSTATGVADLLAMGGLPFRTAHEVVALAAGRATGTGGEAAETADADAQYAALDAAAREVLGDPLEAYVSSEDVRAALDPAESVAMRDSAGGPAAGAVDAQLADARTGVAADEETLADRRAVLAAAERTLKNEVSDYV